MIDWTSIISNPVFWAIYYYSHIDIKGEEDNYEVIEDIFGCELTALAADETLLIPFPESYEWRIEFSTAPGIYHTLAHPDFAEPLLLGYDDPHCMLPILRWPEIAPLVRCAQQHNHITFDPRALYLLFFPLASRTEDEDNTQVRQHIIQAWHDFGIIPTNKVSILVERSVWKSETMSSNFRSISVEWHHDDALGWITNAKHSYRNPDNAWTPDDFARWNAFLDLVIHRER